MSKISKTQTVVSEVLAGSVLGGGVGALLSAINSKEKFKNTNKDDDDAAMFGAIAGITVVLLIFLVILFILSIVFLIAIYKMMPSYKALHTLMTFFIGPIWYIPALIYYCVANDYTLMLPGFSSSVGANMGAMNNRTRNSKYL